jgi:hypothetical protein
MSGRIASFTIGSSGLFFLSLFVSLLHSHAALAAVETWVKLQPDAVTASTYDTGGEPANAVDGNSGTWWAGRGSGAYITLDYGAAKPIRQIRMGFYQGAARVYGFEIMYSNDGRTFTSAGTFQSSGTTTALETFNVTATGRYLRVVGLANNVNQFNSYTEVQGYAPAATGGTAQIDDGFEGSTVDPTWQASGNNTAATSASFARTGSRSLQLTLASTDANRGRTEVVRSDTSGYFTTGNTYCMSFSVLLNNWTTIPSWNTILQTHAAPGDWSATSGRNSVTLGIRSENNVAKIGLYVVQTQRTTPPSTGAAATGNYVTSIDATMGAWHDFVIRFRPSKTTDGIIEVWADGAKIYSQLNAPNMDLYDSLSNPQQNYDYLKLGIYKNSADTGSQEIYYDDVELVRNPTTCSGE